ncbi:hypothetical protein OBBRIDRAFT_839804 [Obba rivulosa]|uniref:Ribonuclease H1 N-terminal domain-containing protein n=1 Tax=Obba rivulosa TaxID=1052685 RepID=A0A8E2DFZ2_9APHY|nr:hypothetical protein OBBRIDRAFT_839804 [Obba rivulosa]
MADAFEGAAQLNETVTPPPSPHSQQDVQESGSQQGMHGSQAPSPYYIAPPPGLDQQSDWYAVTHGHVVGVFTDAHLVHSYTNGVSGAFCKRHPTRNSAITAFMAGFNEKRVWVIDA